MEKLKPLEVELRRLEDLSESIVNDFAYMKKREEEMRDTNGKKTTQLVILKQHINYLRERKIDWSIIVHSLSDCTCFIVFYRRADAVWIKSDFNPVLVAPD